MFLDIATGILLSIGANWYFGTELTFWLILLGVVFVLFPDIDFLIEMVRHGNVGGKVIREHREITHFPLIYVPLIVLAFLFLGTIWAVFFGLTIFLHYYSR